MKLLPAMLLVFVVTGHAQSRSDSVPKRGIVLGIHLVTALAPTAGDFFTEYQRTLGGGTAAFASMTGIGGSVAIDLSPVFCVVLQAQTLGLVMDDAGDFIVKNPTTGTIDTTAKSSNHWSAKTYPFLAGLRYTPVPSRFASYVQVVGGFAVTQLIWQHTTFSTSDPQRFPSGYFQSTAVTPTIAIGAGFELQFDEFDKRELLRGVSLEARYRWATSSFDVFGPLAAHGTEAPASWHSTYPMNFGGFELLLGLHLQFYK